MIKKIWSYLKETISEWNEDGASRLAAALSYYTIFSLAPLLVIAVAIAGLVFSQSTIQNQLNSQLQNLLGGRGATAVMTMLASTRQTGTGIVASIFSIVVLLFGASGVFGQLQTAMNIIWDVKEDAPKGLMHTIQERFVSFTMVLGVGFLLLVSLIISAALSALNGYLNTLLPGVGGFIWQVLGFLISFAVITLIFALIIKVLPDRHIAWRDVWVGAILTALLFNIGKYLIGLYLSRASVTSAYGAAGSLVIVLLWVYYSAQILFLGAEFTQVYVRRRHPERAAERVTGPVGAAVQAGRIARPLRESPAGGGVLIPATGRAPASEMSFSIVERPATQIPANVMTAAGLMLATATAWGFVLFRLIIPQSGPFRPARPRWYTTLPEGIQEGIQRVARKVT
jgi:membrane protein